jgi:hypothetical protein
MKKPLDLSGGFFAVQLFYRFSTGHAIGYPIRYQTPKLGGQQKLNRRLSQSTPAISG